MVVMCQGICTSDLQPENVRTEKAVRRKKGKYRPLTTGSAGVEERGQGGTVVKTMHVITVVGVIRGMVPVANREQGNIRMPDRFQMPPFPRVPRAPAAPAGSPPPHGARAIATRRHAWRLSAITARFLNADDDL
eukprot:9480614-Pyramimonas_sp.AAC.1